MSFFAIEFPFFFLIDKSQILIRSAIKADKDKV